jgi:very-short-patch-repair endonuclease
VPTSRTRTACRSPRRRAPCSTSRVDLLWREIKLIVEVDGYRFHSSRVRFQSDRRRHAILQTAGYTVVRVSAGEVETEPHAVLARIAQVIGALTRAAAYSRAG